MKKIFLIKRFTHSEDCPLLVPLVAAIAGISFWNFFNSLPFQVVDLDAFQYLTFSKSVFFGEGILNQPIRSPVVVAFIGPNLIAARLLMVFYHIGISVLIYLLAMRLFHSKVGATFAMLAYGGSWWMLIFQISPLTDLPGMLLFLSGLLLWLRADKPNTVKASLILGVACLVRFDLILLVAPLILLTQKGLKRYLLIPVVCIVGPLEWVLDVLIYKQFVYAPWEFFKTNLLTFGMGWQDRVDANPLTLGKFAKRDLLFVANILWSTFPHLVALSLLSLRQFRRFENRLLLGLLIPSLAVLSLIQPYEPRIVIVKALPLLVLLCVNAFTLLNHRVVWRPIRILAIIGLFAALISSNLGKITQLTYEPRRFETKHCASGKICSNFPSAVEYYCGVKTTHMIPTGEIEPMVPAGCDTFVYFKDIAGYAQSLDEKLQQQVMLLHENTAARVYQNRHKNSY